MSRLLDRIEREMKRPPLTRQQVLIRRASMVVLCILIPLVGSELILRLVGYQRPQIDFSVQQKLLVEAVDSLNRRFATDAFEMDSHLLWRLKPGANLSGLDVDDGGFLTWERPPSGPRNVRPLTVVCLGDSVTAVTYKTYPEIAERLAAMGAKSRPVQVVNVAVPGYSTQQALRLLPKLRELQPDAVVLCFGWNDHFPALSLPDSDLGASNVVTRKMHNWLKSVRLYQLVGSPLGMDIKKRRELRSEESALSGNARVPLPEYRKNLTELVTTVRSWAATPILATQPENLKDTAEAFLARNSFVLSPEVDNRTLHSQYNQAVRDTAVALDVPLLDLEEEFMRRPREFMLEPDGIHLTGRGHNHVARLVLGALRNEGLITPGDYDAIAEAEKHDTTAPDKPRVEWTLVPNHVTVVAGQAFSFSAIPQNSGNTRWLARNVLPRFGLEEDVPYGSTSVFTRWRTVDSPTTGIASRMPMRSDVLPGEATSMTLTLQAPVRPGNFELEVGLISDTIGPLTAYGAESTTLTVSTVEP